MNGVVAIVMTLKNKMYVFYNFYYENDVSLYNYQNINEFQLPFI